MLFGFDRSVTEMVVEDGLPSQFHVIHPKDATLLVVNEIVHCIRTYLIPLDDPNISIEVVSRKIVTTVIDLGVQELHCFVYEVLCILIM